MVCDISILSLQPEYSIVLILVLMEYGLRLSSLLVPTETYVIVLILVLMEYGLRRFVIVADIMATTQS